MSLPNILNDFLLTFLCVLHMKFTHSFSSNFQPNGVVINVKVGVAGRLGVKYMALLLQIFSITTILLLLQSK